MGYTPQQITWELTPQQLILLSAASKEIYDKDSSGNENIDDYSAEEQQMLFEQMFGVSAITETKQ